jgi:hypothetical protein
MAAADMPPNLEIKTDVADIAHVSATSGKDQLAKVHVGVDPVDAALDVKLDQLELG